MGEAKLSVQPWLVGLRENGVENDLSEGWQSEASRTVGAEFDERPLGSLNVELYTILFSC